MFFRRIEDENLAQAAYMIGCQKSGEVAVIDPERDVDRYIDIAERNGLKITAVAETHIHADFLSGARELAEKTGATLYLSAEGGEDWQYNWLNAKEGEESYSHTLMYDGDSFKVGNIEIQAVHTPGHTPEHLSFLVYDNTKPGEDAVGILTGDFVFAGDVGRPDLLESAAGVEGASEPAAEALYDSLRWFNRLDDVMQVWPAHSAGSACGKDLSGLPTSTIGYEKRHNRPLTLSQGDTDTFVRDILDGQPDPPYYFGRMKRENRDGVALLGVLPQPGEVSVSDIASAVASGEAVLLDTRDWNTFRQSHLRGSYYTPFNKTFPTVAGSYVRPEQTVYLVAHPSRIEEMVRNLVRIGVDHIRGYVTPEKLDEHLATNSSDKAEISLTTPDGLAANLREKNVTVLDVRGESEYREGHVRGAMQLAHTRLPAGINNLPDSEPLFVHCLSGARSAVAAAYLQAQGKDVVYVSGKFKDFPAAGLPIAKSPRGEEEVTA